jgi:hypothetical protein
VSKLSVREFSEHLQAIGLVPPQTRRIIIDVQVGECVKIYYDTFASPTLLQAINPEFLMSAEVIKHEPEPRCHGCGDEPGQIDVCPYVYELGGNQEPCNCCDSCRTGCARDI